LVQQFEAAPAALHKPGGAQGYPERAWAVECLGERDFFGGERSRFGLFAEREVGEGGV
jgi:hypothetical protein